MFIFTLLCGASKGFMKALKAPFEASQKSENKNLSLFILMQLSEMHGAGRVKMFVDNFE